MSKTKYLKQKTKYLKRKTKNRRRTKRGGAAAALPEPNPKTPEPNSKMPESKPRKLRGLKFIPSIIKPEDITQYFNDTKSKYLTLREIPSFELSDIKGPPFDTRTREVNKMTILNMYYYTEPPYFYKKCIFNFENISEPEYQHLIKAFLNELIFNIQAVSLMDTCDFKTPNPNGYHFSVNPDEKTVTFVLRLEYINLSTTKSIVNDDLPFLQKIDHCLHKHQLQHGDMAKRNMKKMADGKYLIYDWGEAAQVGVGGISNGGHRVNVE